MSQKQVQPPTIFLIAGEASADLHAASLLRELKGDYPGLRCFGVGGKALAAEGMEILVDSSALNVVGGSDWMDRLSEVLGAYKKIVHAIHSREADCAILLDLPDLNLRMAKKLHAAGVPVAYYISPQVWAWRRYRVNTIRRVVDRMLVVFPFEEKFYRDLGVGVEFVGHPLLDNLSARASYRTQAEVSASPRIALLPGSRRSELRYHAPILSELAGRLLERFPRAQLKVPVASTLPLSQVREVLSDSRIELVDGDSYGVMAWADVAAVASGTATLETALVGTPFCLFYEVSWTSAFFYNHLSGYHGFLGMQNLLHGREVVREFFHEQATPDNLFREVERLIVGESDRRELASALRACREILGSRGASRRVADRVGELLQNRNVDA